MNNKVEKCKLNKFKKKATVQLLKNEQIKVLKLQFENGSFESNFDYLFKCFNFITNFD